MDSSTVINVLKNMGGMNLNNTFGNITTTSITNSGTMSSGASTFSGAVNAGANYIRTTGTGLFGPLVSTSGIYNTNNTPINWGDNLAVPRPIMSVNASNETYLRPASSAANTQIQKYDGTVLLTVDNTNSTFATNVVAGANYIQTTGTGVFGPIQALGVTGANPSYLSLNCRGNPSGASVTTSGGGGFVTVFTGTKISSSYMITVYSTTSNATSIYIFSTHATTIGTNGTVATLLNGGDFTAQASGASLQLQAVSATQTPVVTFFGLVTGV